jgi:hypothetical protein
VVLAGEEVAGDSAGAALSAENSSVARCLWRETPPYRPEMGRFSVAMTLAWVLRHWRIRSNASDCFRRIADAKKARKAAMMMHQTWRIHGLAIHGLKKLDTEPRLSVAL